MRESPSPSRPDEAAAAPGKGKNSRRSPESDRDPAEFTGFAHLPERDFFALNLDTTLLPVDFPDEEEKDATQETPSPDAVSPVQNGAHDTPDPAQEHARPAEKTPGPDISVTLSELEKFLTELTPAPDASSRQPGSALSPEVDGGNKHPAPAQERATDPEKTFDTDISATLSELEKFLTELTPAPDASSRQPDAVLSPETGGKKNHPAPVQKRATDPEKNGDAHISATLSELEKFLTELAPAAEAPSRQPRTEQSLNMEDHTLLPLPDTDAAPFIPAPSAPASSGAESMPAGAKRIAATRNVPSAAGPAASALSRPVAPRATPLDPARSKGVAHGRNTRPAMPARSAGPETEALQVLAELKQMLSELSAAQDRNNIPRAAAPSGDRLRSRSAPLRPEPAFSPATDTPAATASERPAPPPGIRFPRLANIPLVDPDPPAPEPRAVSPDLPTPPPVDLENAPPAADIQPELPRPDVEPPSPTAAVAPPRAPGRTARLAARLKRLLGRSSRPVESVPAAEAPAPLSVESPPALRADDRTPAASGTPTPTVAEPIPAQAAVSSMSAPGPKTRPAPVSPDRPATAAFSKGGSSRPTPAERRLSAAGAPDRPPNSTPDAPPASARPKTEAPAPAPKVPWPKRLLARLKRGRAVAPSPADCADDTPRPSLLQRLRTIGAKQRALLLHLSERARGSIYPSWEARRHLLALSLAKDRHPTPNPEKENEGDERLHVLRDDARSSTSPDDWKTLAGVALLTAVAGVLLYAAMNPARLDEGLNILRGLLP